MKYIALIVAGGSGTRMGSNTPKQFLELDHKPVLMHTIEKFRHSSQSIILVLPSSQLKFWKKLCEIHRFEIPHQLVEGGDTRLHSVYNGLKHIDSDCIVAIHDGVRPFIDEKVISLSYKTAEEKGSAVVSIKLKDSIREIHDGKNRALPRDHYALIQTPQTFRHSLIYDAYKKLMDGDPDANLFTDDASVAEKNGNIIALIEGNDSNIKITTPDDLLVAEVLLKRQ